MRKYDFLVIIAFLIHWFPCSTANAKEILIDDAAPSQVYFKPYSADGIPVKPLGSESNDVNKNWVLRELGEGLKVVAGIDYEKNINISATLLFIYYDKKPDVFADDFELHVFPDEKKFKPSEIRRKTLAPRDTQNGELLYLKFPVQPENIEQLALVFPSDTISLESSINVMPFRFEKINGAAVRNPLETLRPITVKQPQPVQERMKSCNPQIAITAAEEVLHKQASFKNPLSLFTAAATLFQHGKKDAATFWFYAAQLRTRYQLIYENGDRGQLLQIMLMTIGPPINNYAYQDIDNFRGILNNVLEWDNKTQNPFRDRAYTEAEKQKIASIYTGMSDLQSYIVAEKIDLETKAKKAAPEVERMYFAQKNPKCQTSQINPDSVAHENR